MTLVRSSVRDPLSESFNLGGVERLHARIGRRHAHRRIFRGYPPHEGRTARIAIDDRFAGAEFGIESKSSRDLRHVWTMTLEASLTENWHHVAPELDIGLRWGRTLIRYGDSDKNADGDEDVKAWFHRDATDGFCRLA